ncbi:IS66 family transposase [Patescibacteria group bacterium]|nr:IS66 family transposase [Patescibacteria group bacterium]
MSNFKEFDIQFVTDQGVRYVIENTRGRGVPRQALGDNPDRVLISDFYAAYKIC